MHGAQIWLSVWVLAASGIQLGTLWIMKLSILPMLNSLPYDGYVRVCQLIDMHVFHPIAVWSGVIGAGIGVAAGIASGSALAATLFYAGSACMVIVGITSEVFNRPVWRQIERWTPRRVSDEQWDHKRHNWHIAHEVRTYGAVGAVVAYMAAVLVAA